MARRKRRGALTNSPPTAPDKPGLSPGAEALLDRLKTLANGQIWTLVAPFQMAVMEETKEGTVDYRTRSIEPDTEFTLKGARYGAKGQVIFEFEPIEPGIVQAELGQDKVFTAFPELEAAVIKALGFTPEAGVTWGSAMASFEKEADRRHAEEVKRAKEAEKKAIADNYAHNPLYGIF
jgi:hypothetical protein